MPTTLDFNNRRLLNAVITSKSWLPLRALGAPFVKGKPVTVSGTLTDGTACSWTGNVRDVDDGKYTIFVEMTCTAGRSRDKVQIVPTAAVASAELYPTVTVDGAAANNVLVNIYEE